MTVLCNPIPGSEVGGIDGEPSHLGDFIEDGSATSILMPQFTGYGWRKSTRAAEREKAAFQKSKQAAIEKHGAVLVNAAERWARPRYPEVSRTYLAEDPYEFFIRLYRGGYRLAMWDAARRRRSKPATKSSIPRVDTRSTLRAVQCLQNAPSRPFVGAYLLEARRG
jgi:hypothetical protein